MYGLLLCLILSVSWKNLWSTSNHIIFCLTCVVNSAWAVVFMLGTDTGMLVCLFIIACLPILLFMLWVGLYQPEQKSWGYYAQRNIVAFYYGWSSAALCLSFGVVLVFLWNMTQKEFLIIFWILAPLLTVGATVMNSVMQGVNGFKSFLGVWVSVLWGAAGALVTTLDNRHNL